MNMSARKRILKSVIYTRNSYVCIWYLVASWACEVNQLDAKIRNK